MCSGKKNKFLFSLFDRFSERSMLYLSLQCWVEDIGIQLCRIFYFN